MAHKSSTEAQPLLHTQPHTCTNPYSLQLNHDHCIHYIKGHWGAHIVDWASMQTDVFTDLKLCMLLPCSAVTMVDLWHQCMRLLWAVTLDWDSFVTVIVVSVGCHLVVSCVCKTVSYHFWHFSQFNLHFNYWKITSDWLTDWYFQLWAVLNPSTLKVLKTVFFNVKIHTHLHTYIFYIVFDQRVPDLDHDFG